MDMAEAKSIQKNTTQLNEAICAATGQEAQVFADLLTTDDFILPFAANNIVSTSHSSTYSKVSKLVNIVHTVIATSSQERARQKYKTFIDIVRNKLQLGYLADQLEQDCPVKSDPPKIGEQVIDYYSKQSACSVNSLRLKHIKHFRQTIRE